MYTHNNLQDLNNIEPTMIKNEDFDEILRGEISAVEAYEQVMEKVDNDPEKFRLKQFKLDHQNAVQFWKKQARLSNKVPQADSNLWGSVVEAFVGTSKLIGEEAALIALKKGEEHGLANYEKMLKSDKLSSFQHNEILNTFIPRQRRHIKNIDNLLEMD